MSRPRWTEGLRGPADFWRSTSPEPLAAAHLALVLVAFFVGAAYALLSRAEFLAPGRALLEAETFGQMVTLHGALLMGLCAGLAFPAVLGNFLVPALSGRRDFAHPGLARWAMRLHAAALALALLSTAFGALEGGWTLLPPWSTSQRMPALFFAAALHLAGVALAAIAVNQLVSLARREVEASLLTRAVQVGAVFSVLGGGALASAAVLLLAEATGRGGDLPGALPGYAALLEFSARATVAIVLAYAVGIVGEVCATAARKAPHAPGTTIVALVGCGGLLLLARGDGDLASASIASAAGLLAAVPATILAVNLVATLQNGAIRVDARFFLALTGAVALATGGVAGIFLFAPRTGAWLQGTSFPTAWLHMLLAGGGTSVFLAGLVHWWPSITGVELASRRLNVAVVLHFAGLQLAFLPAFVLGARGAAVQAQVVEPGAAGLARLCACGAFLLVAALVLFGLEFLGSVLRTSAVPVRADEVSP